MSIAVPAELRDRDLPRQTSAKGSTVWWGMLGLIATEGMLFAMMLFSYFYIASTSPSWPPPGIPKPDLTAPIIATCTLFMGCITLGLAEQAMKADLRWLLLLLLGLSFALGSTFLGIQLATAWGQPFTPQTNTYGSLFTVITGLHDVHVFVGELMLMFIMLRAAMGHFSNQRYLGIQVTALYWYFMFAVWLAIFVSLFLIPYALVVGNWVR